MNSVEVLYRVPSKLSYIVDNERVNPDRREVQSQSTYSGGKKLI